MRSVSVVVGGCLALLTLPILVVVVGGGGDSDATPAGGLGFGLRSGSVPAAYAVSVSAAGGVCGAAPASVIAAQIEQESEWNPRAVSSAGAEGLSQFLPSTWPQWSQPGQSPFDPGAAIAAQARYDCAIAAQMTGWQTQGRVSASLTVTQLMLAGYNAGPYAVLAAGGIPNNGQTPDYVTRITGMAGKYADTTGDEAPAGSPFGARVVAAALSQIGQPYAWIGGTYTGPTLGVCGPNGASNDCHITGWDCSGLVMFAVFQASSGAIRLPHFSDVQTRTGAPVSREGLAPGDVISFTAPGASTAHHVGIYAGGGQMIDAPESGTTVRVDSLATPYYQSQAWRAVRYG